MHDATRFRSSPPSPFVALHFISEFARGKAGVLMLRTLELLATAATTSSSMHAALHCSRTIIVFVFGTDS